MMIMPYFPHQNPTMDSSNPSSSYPVNPVPVFYPYPTPYTDGETLCRLQHENDTLRHRLALKTVKDYALIEACQLQGQCYWSILPSGKLEKFTDFVFESVRLLQFDIHTGHEPLFELTITSVEPFLLSEREFLHNQTFYSRLQQYSKGRIRPFGSVSKVATLLRSLACKQLEHVFVPFFAGWVSENTSWHFQVFPHFQTCARTVLPIMSYDPLPKVLPAHTKIAAMQLQADFTGIRNLALRTLLLLWMHAAFLHTLLANWNLRICHALCLSVSSLAAQSYLEILLSFGEKVLSLSIDSEDLLSELVARKDKTIVIREGQNLGVSLKNLDSIQSALIAGKIKFEKARGSEPMPVYTLPIILSEKSSSTFLPGSIVIQMTQADFDLSVCEQLKEKHSHVEYWAAFAAYAETNISKLKDLLAKNIVDSHSLADEHELTSPLANLFGVLCGLEQFLEGFSMSIDLPSFFAESDWKDLLLSLLEESSLQAETLDGLAEMFVEVGRQMIHDHRFACYLCGQRGIKDDQSGSIYCDSEAFSFDRFAFDRICIEARMNPAAVKRDLREKGYLIGKPTNAGSFTTRICCWDVYGQSKILRVYKIARDRFEELGEPPLL